MKDSKICTTALRAPVFIRQGKVVDWEMSRFGRRMCAARTILSATVQGVVGVVSISCLSSVDVAHPLPATGQPQSVLRRFRVAGTSDLGLPSLLPFWVAVRLNHTYLHQEG